MNPVCFDADLARTYGLPEAILLNRFQFLLQHNAAHASYQHNGRTWCFATVRGLASLYPFWSRRVIERALKSLVTQGVILRTLHWHDRGDQRSWFTFADDHQDLMKACHHTVTGVSPHGDGGVTKMRQGCHQTVTQNSRSELDKQLEKGIKEPSNPSANGQTVRGRVRWDVDDLLLQPRVKFCQAFQKHEEERAPQQKRFSPAELPHTVQQWLTALDELERLDQVSLRNLTDLHKRVIADPFWKEQIRSPAKYRKKNEDGQTYFEFLWHKFMENGGK